MNKDNKFFIGIVLLLLASMIAIGVIVFRDKREEQSKMGGNAEGLIFKNEYESLNNVIREKDGKTIKEIPLVQTILLILSQKKRQLLYLKVEQEFSILVFQIVLGVEVCYPFY